MLKVENREGSVTKATGEGKAHQSPEAIPWRVQTGVWSHRHIGVTQKNLERLAVWTEVCFLNRVSNERAR